MLDSVLCVLNDIFLPLRLCLEYFQRIKPVFIFMYSNTNNSKQKYLYDQNKSISLINTFSFLYFIPLYC